MTCFIESKLPIPYFKTSSESDHTFFKRHPRFLFVFNEKPQPLFYNHVLPVNTTKIVFFLEDPRGCCALPCFEISPESVIM